MTRSSSLLTRRLALLQKLAVVGVAEDNCMRSPAGRKRGWSVWVGFWVDDGSAKSAVSIFGKVSGDFDDCQEGDPKTMTPAEISLALACCRRLLAKHRGRLPIVPLAGYDRIDYDKKGGDK